MDLFKLFPAGTFYDRADVLEQSIGAAHISALSDKRNKAINELNREVWSEALRLFAQLGDRASSGFSVVDGVVACGQSEIKTEQEALLLKNLITAILPWRKGPWNIGGQEIDSEWRSDVKFASMEPLYKEFKDKTILDIGSGNGYYAARLHALGAARVVCFDPSERFLLQFELFQKFAKQETLQLELLGYEDAHAVGQSFDIVLCMGVLYHQKNPLAVIEACRAALRPGGMLVLESMTYPSKDSIAFIPPERYAKARNVYFLPSVEGMISLCQRCGFKGVELLNERPILVSEQRQTTLAPYESLLDFLDPTDSTKTIEGWPAPQRALVVAYR